jgi:hypothetical protein
MGCNPLLLSMDIQAVTPSDVTRMDAHHIEWLSPIEDEAWKDLKRRYSCYSVPYSDLSNAKKNLLLLLLNSSLEDLILVR